MEKPLLYLSVFFEKKKQLYYDNLMLVRQKNDMRQWLKYFLVGIEQTATDAVTTLSSILKLKSDIEHGLQENYGRRSASAYKLLQYLFKQPIINVDMAAVVCGINYRPANELVQQMCANHVLKEITGQSRNRLFEFKPYLSIFN